MRSMVRLLVTASSAALVVSASVTAHALIPIPVGGHPRELDVFTRVTLERGLVEPNENKASWQKASWDMVTVGGGYGLGHFGVFQDLAVRGEITGYHSPEEVNDLTKGAVVDSRCAGTVLGPGRCQFHPADKGAFITPSISTSLVTVRRLRAVAVPPSAAKNRGGRRDLDTPSGHHW